MNARAVVTEAKLLLIGLPVFLWTILPVYHMVLFAISPKDSAFAGRYARTGPLEDFSESFAAYFLQKAGRSWSEHISGGGPAAIGDKIKLIGEWLANPTAGATGSGGTGSNSLEVEPHDHAHDHAHVHTH